MKILVYTDVHANKYALEQLQNTNDYKTADLRVFLGDAVSMCPYPNECLKAIFDNGDIFLMGNHDSYFAFGLPDDGLFFKEKKKAHLLYMRDKTKKEYREKLKTVPKDYTIEVQGKKFYFTHYIWESERIIMSDPDEPSESTIRCAKLFDNVKADYILFGHNHKPADFECDGKHFICVGSLGMKYPGNYAVVEVEDGKVDIKRKKIEYDVKRLKEEMIIENYPMAANFCKWFDQDKAKENKIVR